MEYHEIFALDDPFQADVVEEALKRECVPYKILATNSNPVEPIFALQHRWGAVLVPDAAREMALSIIHDVLEASLPASEDGASSDASRAPDQ